MPFHPEEGYRVKKDKPETYSVIVFSSKRGGLKEFEIQYMHSPFKLHSFMLVATKEGIISDMGKYLF